MSWYIQIAIGAVQGFIGGIVGSYLTMVYHDWRNRPRVKTGPMPISPHPYR